MPDESCRKCGGQLRKHSVCAECRQEINQICIECGNMTELKFHAECFYFIHCIH